MKRWRAPLGLAIGVALGFVLVRTEVGFQGVAIFQFFPPVAIAILALVCFRDLARRDRIAFVSIIGPAMAVALVSVALPGILNPAVALFAIGFISLFVFTNWFAAWWWRHILRRRVPTAIQRFERGLLVGINAWVDAMTGPGTLTREQVRAADDALTEMRALDAPTSAWGALRDGYVNLGERWILLDRDFEHAEEAMHLQHELAALGARLNELHERG